MASNSDDSVIELSNVAASFESHPGISPNGNAKLVSFSTSKVRPKLYTAERDFVSQEAAAELVGTHSRGNDDMYSEDCVDIPKKIDFQDDSASETASTSRSSVTGASSIVSRHLRNNRFKRWWHQVPLMSKMLVIGGLPALGLIILTALRLSEDMKKIEDGDNAVLFVEYGQLVLNLLTHTQVERALTQVMMGNPSPENIAILANHRENKTDIEKNRYIDFIKSGQMNGLQFTKTTLYSQLTNSIIGLEQHRELVDELKVSAEDSVVYFNSMNDRMVSVLWFGENVFTDVEEISLLVQLCLKTGLGESLGIERMLGSKAIIAGGLSPDAFITYLERITSSLLWEKQFEDVEGALKLGSDTEGEPLPTESETYLAARELADRYRDVLKTNNGTLIRGYDWQEYFNNFTVLILAHKQEALSIFDQLASQSSQLSSEAQQEVVVLVIVLVVVIAVTTILVLIMVGSIRFSNNILRSEVKKRKTTEKAIWRFFPQEFMTLLNKSDILNVQQGDRRQLKMCVMFSDIRNFTTNSEKLGAEQTYDWLMDYVQAMGPVIKRHNGFIDKTLGDGIMALFTTSQDALDCALAMQVEAEKLNLDNFRNETPAYNVGIGLHTGNVVLGVIGDHHRLEGTIVSDAVNTAARIEGLCKFYQSRIIISGDTYADCDMDCIGHRYLGSVRCVGKLTNLDVYDVYQSDPAPMYEFKNSTKESFESATRSFQAGNLSACVSHMEELSQRIPQFQDGAIERRIRLCSQLERSGIPDGWQGEDIASEK